jgi:hypothetical protein
MFLRDQDLTESKHASTKLTIANPKGYTQHHKILPSNNWLILALANRRTQYSLMLLGPLTGQDNMQQTQHSRGDDIQANDAASGRMNKLQTR